MRGLLAPVPVMEEAAEEGELPATVAKEMQPTATLTDVKRRRKEAAAKLCTEETELPPGKR